MKQLRTLHNPPVAGPQLELLRIKDTNIHPFVILSKGIFGLFTHWDAKALKGRGASAPCYRNPDDCDGCRRRLPERWKGYVHVFDMHSRKDGFLELTPTAAAALKAQLTGVDNWRCCRINVSRQGNGEKTRLKVNVFDSVKESPELPQERCPTETLSRLWKLEPDLDEAARMGISIHCGTSSDETPPNGQSAASG